MRIYYLLLYELWRLLHWRRKKRRFWRRESLSEATVSIMVVVQTGGSWAYCYS